jgi:hypothetical protein
MPKRIFVIADFKDEYPRAVRVERRRWPKGFVRAGHDVQRFSYRNILTQFNPFSGKKFRRFMPKFVKRRANDILARQVRAYHPDIIFIELNKYIDSQTITRLREAAPDAVIVYRDCDPFPEKYPLRAEIVKNVDIVTATNGGRFLQHFKDVSGKKCAFIPNPCDPDIQRSYDNLGEEWKSDIIFTGKETHKRLADQIKDENEFRLDLLGKLSEMKNVKLYGAFGNPKIDGVETFWATSGAKIALSINIINDVRLYHSDRLVNCVSCGTFTLAKRVPGTELLFEDGKHLRYFDTVEEFFELAGWYLKHEDEREQIARAGIEYTHREFNCARMAEYVVELVETGDYKAPWKVIL